MMGIILVVGLIISAINFAMMPEGETKEDGFEWLDKLMDKAQSIEDRKNRDK